MSQNCLLRNDEKHKRNFRDSEACIVLLLTISEIIGLILLGLGRNRNIVNMEKRNI